MINISKNQQQLLFLFMLLFFGLAFVNIVFSLLGLVCFILPFIMLHNYKKNVWCQSYCPRGSFLSVFLSKISLNRKPSKWFIVNGKKAFLIYICISMFFAIMSTIMVYLGRINPIDYVKFIIVFRAPFNLPQLLNLTVNPTLLHFSYRIYSIMFSSTIIAIIIGIIYYPRTWCTVCPMKQILNYVKK